MTNSKGILLVIASAMLVTLFQNCGRYELLDTSDISPGASVTGVSSSASHLAISSNLKDESSQIEPEAPDQLTPPNPVDLLEHPSVKVRFESATLLQFGEVLRVAVAESAESEDNNTDRNNWFGILNRYTDDGLYKYELNLKSGVVIEKASGEEVYQLSKNESNELKLLFKGGLVINSSVWTPGDLVCSQVYEPGYARLLTSRGFYELGATTSSCSVLDLYKIENKTAAGLKESLRKLQERIALISEPVFISNSQSTDSESQN